MNENIEKRVILVAEYIIKNKATIRSTANYTGSSKSTVHMDVHKRLKRINKNLYNKVQRILDENFKTKHIRGGESTKAKYKKQQYNQLSNSMTKK